MAERYRRFAERAVQYLGGPQPDPGAFRSFVLDHADQIVATLCLLPDRYAYDYGGAVVGDPASPLRLACQPHGPVPIPTALPEVVWRRGVDLDPVDLGDPDEVRWLESCVWPDQPHRLARRRAAVAVARTDPPLVVRGDLLDQVGPMVAQAPAGATVVVFHAAVLVHPWRLAPVARRITGRELITSTA